MPKLLKQRRSFTVLIISAGLLLIFSAVFAVNAFVGLVFLGLNTLPVNAEKDSSELLLQTPTDNIFRVSMVLNDMVYNPQDQLIYATRPSSIGSDGNSISRIDPLTGNVVASVWVGSEPDRLALSDNGQTLYVSLKGALGIRRYDASTQTPGIQFSNKVGTSFTDVWDLEVAPGNPDLVVMSGTSGAVAFNNGVRLPTIANGEMGSIIFSASAATLYGGDTYNGLRTMTVNANGVSFVNLPPTSFSSGGLKFENNLIFDSQGHIIDAATRTLRGTCSGINTGAFVPDTTNNRVLYATKQDNFSNIKIKAFDLDTFLEIGSLEIPNTSGGQIEAVAMIRYGTNGLALRTWGNNIYFIQTALLPTGNPLPTPSETPVITPSPSPTQYSSFVKSIALSNKDLIYRQSDHKFYATVPGTAGAPRANTITRIEPTTLSLEDSVAVGNEPGRLAFSDDEQTLYVGIDGATSVRKFDMQTQTPGTQFPIGPFGTSVAYDIDVVPGNSDAVVVSYGNQGYNYDGADIYYNGIKQAQRSTFSGTINIASAQTLYVGEGFFAKYAIGPTGLTLQSEFQCCSDGATELLGNLLYTAGGSVFDLNAGNYLGSFVGNGTRPGLAVDVLNNRIFFLSPDPFANPQTWSILAYRLDNYLLIGRIPLPGVSLSVPYSESPRRLWRWGTNGLAFNDVTNNKLYFVKTDLVSPVGEIPTAIRLDNTQFLQVNEDVGTVSVNVLRTGGITGTSTVDYATSDGSATAGEDYTATIGTLTFAPGESSKTVVIPILNDNIYEPSNETFGFALSNPGGNSVVELQTPTMVTVTIQNNDSTPSASASNVTVTEPETVGMTTIATFTVQLSNPSSQTASFNFATQDMTATAGSDYNATSGTLTFEPLETTKTISVTVLADAQFTEPSETFRINTSNNVNLFVNFFNLTGTIINFNPAPTPTATASPTPTATNTATATRTATNTRTPTPTSTVTATATQSPTPTFTATPVLTPTPVFVRRVSVTMNDFVLSSSDSSIYAVIPSTVGAPRGNSITKISPTNGMIGDSVFVGSEPNKLAISDDGNTLYSNLGGAKSVRRFDVPTQTPGPQFIPESPFTFFHSFAVRPGSPQTIAIANGTDGVAIFDDGVKRPLHSDGGAYAINSIAFAGPDVIYGFDNESSGFELKKFMVNINGVSSVNVGDNLITGFGVTIQYSNGLLYSTGGRVVNPATASVVGNFPSAFGSMAIDQAAGRIFFMDGTTLRAYNINTLALIGTVTIPGLNNVTGRLVRWGQNGLAIRDANNLYLVQSPLISPNGTLPTGLQLSAQTYSTSESNANLIVTVNRSGDLSGTSTVAYTTTDGTAIGGLDFTVTSGTLTFSPGQASKTVNIPLTNDNINEGNETFGFAISNPSGDGTVEIIEPAAATLTINDNDSQPGAQSPNVSVNEPQIIGASTSAVFTVTLSRQTTQTVTVDFATSDVTATAGSDYIATSGTLTWAPLETSKTISVPVLGDQESSEPNETFRVLLSNPVNVSLFTQQMTGTIINNPLPVEPTPTPTPPPGISGSISYANAIGAPTPRPVSNVTVSATGPSSVFTATIFPSGDYSLANFLSGTYTVTPTKTGGINGITSFDAARVAQHVAGVNILTGTQFTVADVSGNGTLSSFDAGQIAGYVAAISGSGLTGNWTFSPANRIYTEITTAITGQDYSAFLMGEVSGNWNNTGARPAGTVNSEQWTAGNKRSWPEIDIAVEMPTVVGSVDKEIVVPVNVQGIADKNVIAYEFDLRYDPSVVQPIVDAADVNGTVSRGLVVVTNATEPGLLRVAVYGAIPIDEDGVLLNLRFTSVGSVGAISPLSFDRIMFNEGDRRVLVADGLIEIVGN